MRRSTIAVLGLSLALAVPAAAETVNTPSISIPVTAADLENEASIHALYTRVEQAANAVCAEGGRDFQGMLYPTRTCRRDTIAEAIAQAGIPALSRHYAALQNGETPEAATEIATR